MSVRVPVLAGLLLAALATMGTAQKARAKVYETPQDVFDAFLAAVNKHDSKAFVACLTPEALKDLAARRAVATLQKRAEIKGDRDEEKLDKKYRPILDVLDRHGLTKKEIKLGEMAKERAKARETVLRQLKDPGAFLADLLDADDKVTARKSEKIEARLTDMKIDGDRASGIVVITEGDTERKLTYEFTKIGASWKLDPRPKDEKAPKDKQDREEER